MTMTLFKLIALSSIFTVAACATPPESGDEVSIRPETLTHYSKRPITDDVMYFVLPDRFNNGDTSNDRGGMVGDAQTHGFDPSQKGFYHGGDLKGLTAKLDYLAEMGISAVWLTPIFKNRTVEPNIVNSHSSYHGYWVTDFTQIDPHLGSNDDLKELVAEAHKRNMKVIFDIITNHTADVIKYEECLPQAKRSSAKSIPLCQYRSTQDFPDKAYTPYVLEEEKTLKVPSWLNDTQYYHNRGDSEWRGESALMGDFAGLDDLNTELPEVVNGFIDIYKYWISEFKIDGYRIDTVKHVNIEFWQQFVPAILDHAKAVGIENFYIFGEVSFFGGDYKAMPADLGRYTSEGKFPAVLDFGFQSVALATVTQGKAMTMFKELYAQDGLYGSDNGSAAILPTFLSNHDNGRIGHFLLSENPDLSPDEALKRSELGHALMLLSRGVPVVYYGDEQGFTGDGNDQDAREDMFESRVPGYNDNVLLGSQASTADNNFDSTHALYQTIKKLTLVRRAHHALLDGSQSVIHADEAAGILALKHVSKDKSDAVLVVFNGSRGIATASLKLENDTKDMCFVAGEAGEVEKAEGGINYTAPALSWAVYSLKNCK